MRRLSLSTKLFAAALPLVLAVGALLALTVRNDLNEVEHAERGADLGSVWTPLVAALTSIETELADIPARPDADTAGGIAEVDPETTARLAATRRSTDQALTALGDGVGDLGAAEAARKHITQSRTSISGARRAIDMSVLAPGMATEVDPLVAYDAALRELVSIGQLLPAESGEAQLGRELLAVVKLAEARVAADAVVANVEAFQADPFDSSPLATAQVRYAEIESAMNEFSAIAPDEWAKQFRQEGFTTALSQFRFQLDSARRAAESGAGAQFDLEGFAALSDQSLDLQQEITSSIVDRATTRAEEIRKDAFMRTLIALAAVLVAALVAWLLTRSVTRRVKTVARRANEVASDQLPALVEALRDPRGKTVLPTIKPVNDRGSDELAELARAFNTMQATLVDVAHEQVEVLRRGVSDIFVTMARRNRSLIDRQLAMLDEFEAEVDDPDVLSNYYQLDHMATRMRRNSESLLVLANAEPKRRRVKATEIDDVVRAAIGEVEDYRRIEVEALEHLQVRGNVVADVSHLLAELLDNATSFSPPDSVVRVGGRRAGNSYMLRIVDSGVGISSDRLAELNELLREPPIVGLSVEPTLGMSVVSLLASRHDVLVTLSQGSPGTTVDVLLPESMFGPIDVPTPGMAPVRFDTVESAPTGSFDAMDREPSAAASYDVIDEHDLTAEPAIAGEPLIDREVAPSWTTMTVDLSELRAEPSDVEPETAMLAPAPLEFATGDADTAGNDLDEDGPADDLVDPTDEISIGEALDEGLEHQAIVAEAELPTRGGSPALPPPAPQFDETQLEPAVAVTGEFDRPLAPPVTAESLTRRPVSPSDALTPSTVKLPAPALETGLPTRSPGRGPDGPDRLAPPNGTGPSVTPEVPVAPTSSPSALQAALSAFDNRRNGGDSLPTRARSEGLPASFEETVSTTQSRLDPEALRERLRAFQNEFRTAAATGHDHESDLSSNNADLGGDRR